MLRSGRKGCCWGNSQFRAYLAENVQLLLIFSAHAFFYKIVFSYEVHQGVLFALAKTIGW
jgi:hypothetical protein